MMIQPMATTASATTVSTDVQAMASAGRGVSRKVQEKAREFEAVFLNNLLSQMFANIEQEDSLGSAGAGSETWRGILVEQYAKVISEAGGIGIAGSIERQLVEIQERGQR